MDKTQTNYRNLEDRTLEFAKRTITLCKALPKNTVNIELTKQLIRSAGSIGANYREANESLGNKDFIHRLRIARKEAKETNYWLELMKEQNPGLGERMINLLEETQELRNILSSIINKSV